jgi:hypothetical protein
MVSKGWPSRKFFGGRHMGEADRDGQIEREVVTFSNSFR